MIRLRFSAGSIGVHRRFNLLPIAVSGIGIMFSKLATVENMPMRATLRLLVAAAAILSASTASAQIYKWVDEHGVTNYSNQRPAGAKAREQVGVVENRISVYTPDPSLSEAVDAFRMRSNKIGRNSADVEASSAKPYVAPIYVPVSVPADPCTGYRAAHCNEVYTGYYPYGPVAGHRFYRHPHKRIPQIRLRPGAIAGQVVGMDGYIPGNSANAHRFRSIPSRSFSRRAVEPRHIGGRPVQLPARFR